MAFELEIIFLTNEAAQEWVDYVTDEEHFNGVIGIELDTIKMIFHHPNEIKPFEDLARYWDTIVTYGVHLKRG